MKIKSARGLTTVILLLSVILAGPMAFANDANVPDVPLTGALDLTYVGHLEKTDGEGRLLVWEGSIGGDFAGKIKWWFIDPSPVASGTYKGGTVDYYEARWEIWVGEKLVLAGKSAGKTVTPDQSDGMWDGHGVVTEAYGTFEQLKGHKVYETGPVIYGSNPPNSLTGTGMFQIY
jgi:hypothetical protein